jgi:hypothetical protein
MILADGSGYPRSSSWRRRAASSYHPWKTACCRWRPNPGRASAWLKGRSWPVDVEDRHVIDRRGLVVARDGVGDVVGADARGDIGLAEVGIDVLEFEDVVKGHVGLGEQHIDIWPARGRRRDGSRI